MTYVDPSTPSASKCLTGTAHRPDSTAIPLPGNALPTTPLPTDALPSNALPTDALPSNALPSNALPSNALPSDALPTDALPIKSLSNNSSSKIYLEDQSATSRRVPLAVYILGIGIFAMTTSEFAVAGLMPELAQSLGVRVEQIGYLITIFAAAMTIGGPILTLSLLRMPPKTALLLIFAIFLAGNLFAAVSTTYMLMVGARIITGIAAQAFFGISISLCARLVDSHIRGQAVSVVLNGLMLGTFLGLPLATFIGTSYEWQSAFWAIAILTALATTLTIAFVQNPGETRAQIRAVAPRDNVAATATATATATVDEPVGLGDTAMLDEPVTIADTTGLGDTPGLADTVTLEDTASAENTFTRDRPENPTNREIPTEKDPGLREELSVFRRPALLLALLSSMLIIGATFAAFSFFTPILTQLSGFASGTVPLLLLAYGAATVMGNSIVGRLTDRHTITVLITGTVLNALFLACFAIFSSTPALALVFMLGIGLAGVTMNPAMVVRVQRAGNTRPFVNTIHASVITSGVILGSGIGSALVPHYGLRAPIIVGAGMALLAIVTILPAAHHRNHPGI